MQSFLSKFNPYFVESLSLSMGLFTTYYLHAIYDLPVILVSCIGCLFVDLVFKRTRLVTSPFYCGSFAGMISSQLLHHEYHILVLGFSCAMVYQLSKGFFIGFGGKLGSVAFVASMISYCIGAIWN